MGFFGPRTARAGFGVASGRHEEPADGFDEDESGEQASCPDGEGDDWPCAWLAGPWSITCHCDAGEGVRDFATAIVEAARTGSTAWAACKWGARAVSPAGLACDPCACPDAPAASTAVPWPKPSRRARLSMADGDAGEGAEGAAAALAVSAPPKSMMDDMAMASAARFATATLTAAAIQSRTSTTLSEPSIMRGGKPACPELQCPTAAWEGFGCCPAAEGPVPRPEPTPSEPSPALALADALVPPADPPPGADPRGPPPMEGPIARPWARRRFRSACTRDIPTWTMLAKPSRGTDAASARANEGVSAAAVTTRGVEMAARRPWNTATSRKAAETGAGRGKERGRGGEASLVGRPTGGRAEPATNIWPAQSGGPWLALPGSRALRRGASRPFSSPARIAR